MNDNCLNNDNIQLSIKQEPISTDIDESMNDMSLAWSNSSAISAITSVEHVALRDPVHGWIKFTKDEEKVIRSPLVNRLNFVSQINSAIYVYPGACHTRFIHSLGVMNICGKYMKHLLSSIKHIYPTISHDQERRFIQIARLAGLLHDIGHGPFSHSFDRIVYSKIYGMQDGGHDVHRIHLIQTSPLKENIQGCGITTNEIIKCWNAHKPTKDSTIEEVMYYIINLIVGGPLGSDRIDFILRDSYFTGTTHLGTIAWKRIIYNSCIILHNGIPTLMYAYKTLQDIIQALDGRRYMYNAVYLHHKVDGASALIEKVMEAVIKNENIDVNDPEQFVNLDDNYILCKASCIEDEEIKKFATMYKRGILPTCIEEITVDANVKYNEEVWKGLFINEENKDQHIIIRNTRCITGIDPHKFQQYNIMFFKYNKYTMNTDILSCESALNEARFKSIKPYYYVRAFRINTI